MIKMVDCSIHKLNDLQKKMRKIKAKETVFRQESACEEKIKDPLKI